MTAEQLKAAGAMTVLLKETIKPNLVQTLEGQPVFVHCGPFANIAHGNNSLVADRVALKLGDIVVTESGFGSDMGMEKFFDIVCRVGGLRPNAVVLVATVKALKHHGGDPDGGAEAIEGGSANLVRHLGIVREFGLNAVVAVNRFPGDTTRRSSRSGASRSQRGVRGGGERGRRPGAERVRPRWPRRSSLPTEQPSSFAPIYPLEKTIERKIEAIATRVYGADGILLHRPRASGSTSWSETGSTGCRSAWRRPTSRSRTTRRSANAPTGFTVTVRDIRPYTGAGWLVALCGDMQTMPGLGRTPAAHGRHRRGRNDGRALLGLDFDAWQEVREADDAARARGRGAASCELGRGAGPRRGRLSSALDEGALTGVFSCSKATNEPNFATQKFARVALGTNNVDSCNRT